MNTWNELIHDVERMRGEMDRLLSDARPSAWTLPFSRVSFLPGRAARSYPLVNIGEDAENFYVHGLAPGVDPDSLEVSITGNQLSISGEKKHLPEGIEPESVHRNERAAGRFVRNIALSSDVDSAKIKARYTDGLLSVTVPKAETAKPKQIKVSVN